MKIKKILLIIIGLFSLTGCVNLKELSYDEILNSISTNEKNANIYEKGYQYYLPKGLSIINGGTNYAIIGSSDITYYLYVDLVSYINKYEVDYKPNNIDIYSKKITTDKKSGYVEIKLHENNQYLIEIMYNYAKIEVMVNNDLVNKALINSINILKSVDYNDSVINNLLNDDKLNYTEEKFELFEENKDDSNYLDYAEGEVDNEPQEEIKDTDFIN